MAATEFQVGRRLSGGAMGSAYKDTACIQSQTAGPAGQWFWGASEPMLSGRSTAIKQYGAGDLIYSQGAECQGVHCIESGLVGLRAYDADGNSVLIRLRGPGGVVGYRAYVAGTEHLVTAEVLMPARLRFIDRGQLEKLLENNAELQRRFMETAVSDLTETEDRFVRTVTKRASNRVLHMLADLYEHFGRTSASGEPLLELPISRQDLAALVGIVPESLSRVIRRLENAGIARFDGRCVRFTHIERLQRERKLPH